MSAAKFDIYQSNVSQTIFDVALGAYGSVEGLLFILQDNPQLLQQDGTIAQFRIEHKIRKNVAVNKEVKSFLPYPYPATEGNNTNSFTFWIEDDGRIWTNDNNQGWIQH
jgi:hypothetical protein